MNLSKLDITDHDDIRHAKGLYDNISKTEWRTFVEFAFDNKLFSFDEKNFLGQMERKAGLSKFLSANQVFKALGLVERIQKAMEVKDDSSTVSEALQSEIFHPPTRNITFRVAWHDSGWNGHICKDPQSNRYCSGFHSLLSDRLRERKIMDMDLEDKNRGKKLNEIDYVPPCFWSVNLFGTEEIKIQHDNPAAPGLAKIGEKLPPYSVFSWPFAVSFTRSWQETERDGSYPANLENVRIPYFNSKIKKDQSIGFLYANYSNPFTEEEDKYLLVGCGLITDKGILHKFGPKEEIEAIRQKKKKLRNFPELNWALRFSFDSPGTMVRMPYHEYIDYAKNKDLSESEKELLFDSIKVSITEPELEHCFKFVAMDIDDDEAIYLLCKMKQKLIQAMTAGVVTPGDIQNRISKLDSLLEFSWRKRGYFPGFENVCRTVLGWQDLNFPLARLLETLKDTEDDYVEKLLALFEDPFADKKYRQYAKYIEEITEKIQGAYGITTEQLLQLCMLNLTAYQFERIFSGKIEDLEKASRTPLDICLNPYLLFEEYRPAEANLLESTGDIIDNPIELFKIDIAYYPDVNYLERIGLQRGFRYDDKRRIRSLILQYLVSLEDKGDCFEEAAKIEEAIRDYPLFYKAGTEYTLAKDFFLKIDGAALSHLEEKLKVVPANDTRYFYLLWLYEAEKEVEQAFRTLLDEPDNTRSYKNLKLYLDKSVKTLEKTIGTNFDPACFLEERKRLYENLFKKRLFILAGSPGSGKSYELLNIIQELEKQKETYLLLTPTGKAALRLMNDKDFKGIEAVTIDKLIVDIEFGKRSRSAVLNTNNIIIDEMSMVDLLKFQQLLQYLNYKAPSFKRLILVGDPNQLPPIGYGKMLRDIIYFCKTNTGYKENISELATNCRMQLANSKLLELSNSFTYKGEISEELKKLIHSGKEQISDGLRVRFWTNEKMLNTQVEEEFEILCQAYKIKGTKAEKLNRIFGLNANGTFDPSKGFNLENFQLITPYKSAYFGTTFLNEFIQESFRPGEYPEIMDNWFKQSDKVIRTRNYYQDHELIISNGSIGLARSEKTDVLYLPENDYKPIDFYSVRKQDREFFDLAYCITIHKSQGSGFDHTFVIIPQKLSLLSRELVYTALTRCRQSATILIQGDPKIPYERSLLEKARRRSFTEFRKTTLMLGEPFRYYSLEPEPGIFVESRIELMIYNSLLQTKVKLGADQFQFTYESMPVLDEHTVPVKTDFTIHHNGKVYYWEHLGRLDDKNYARKWKDIKYPTYEKYGLSDNLVTSDELNGIDPARIEGLIENVLTGSLITTDPADSYSNHHYSLR